jgi:predicted DNA-binding transcriptional regulator AlpA
MTAQSQIPAEEAFYTRPQLAAVLRCTIQHLENLAASGDGPPMVKFGRSVRYPQSGFRQWVAECTVSSTTEGRSLSRRRKTPQRRPVAVQAAGE